MSDYWKLAEGQTFRVPFNWPADPQGNNADLTGYSVRTYGAGTALSALTASLTDEATGQIEMHMPLESVPDLPEKKEAGVNDFRIQLIAPNGDGVTTENSLWLIKAP